VGDCVSAIGFGGAGGEDGGGSEDAAARVAFPSGFAIDWAPPSAPESEPAGRLAVDDEESVSGGGVVLELSARGDGSGGGAWDCLRAQAVSESARPTPQAHKR
jgi:hypothetical protein